MSIQTRIQTLVNKFCQENKRKFAQKINVSATTLNGILVRGSDPSFKVIQKIAESYPEINLRWLITGKGPMMVNKKEAGAS